MTGNADHTTNKQNFENHLSAVKSNCIAFKELESDRRLKIFSRYPGLIFQKSKKRKGRLICTQEYEQIGICKLEGCQQLFLLADSVRCGQPLESHLELFLGALDC